MKLPTSLPNWLEAREYVASRGFRWEGGKFYPKVWGK